LKSSGEAPGNKTVDENIFEIHLFVGGGMKCLQILLGLGGSTRDFAWFCFFSESSLS
jgi:hypothetical protein